MTITSMAAIRTIDLVLREQQAVRPHKNSEDQVDYDENDNTIIAVRSNPRLRAQADPELNTQGESRDLISEAQVQHAEEPW